MSKRILSLCLCVVLIFSLAGCNRTAEDISSEEIQSPANQDKQETEDTSKNAELKNLIEMRDSKLWAIDEKEADKLSLDGQPYKFPEELLEIIDFTYVIINYPLLIFHNGNVYNLEENELIFTFENISFSLEEEWGNTIDPDKIKFFEDVGPESFNLMYNVSLSPSKKKVAFSVHFYRIATVQTITGFFNLEDSKVYFTHGPFMGQVSNIIWSPNEDHFAYTSDYMGKSQIEQSDIYVINSGDMEKIFEVNSTELFKEELNDEQLPEYFYTRVKLVEWVGNDSLAVQLEFIGDGDKVEKEFTKIIKYK